MIADVSKERFRKKAEMKAANIRVGPQYTECDSDRYSKPRYVSCKGTQTEDPTLPKIDPKESSFAPYSEDSRPLPETPSQKSVNEKRTGIAHIPEQKIIAISGFSPKSKSPKTPRRQRSFSEGSPSPTTTRHTPIRSRTGWPVKYLFKPDPVLAPGTKKETIGQYNKKMFEAEKAKKPPQEVDDGTDEPLDSQSVEEFVASAKLSQDPNVPSPPKASKVAAGTKRRLNSVMQVMKYQKFKRQKMIDAAVEKERDEQAKKRAAQLEKERQRREEHANSKAEEEEYGGDEDDDDDDDIQETPDEPSSAQSSSFMPSSAEEDGDKHSAEAENPYKHSAKGSGEHSVDEHSVDEHSADKHSADDDSGGHSTDDDSGEHSANESADEHSADESADEHSADEGSGEHSADEGSVGEHSGDEADNPYKQHGGSGENADDRDGKYADKCLHVDMSGGKKKLPTPPPPTDNPDYFTASTPSSAQSNSQSSSQKCLPKGNSPMEIAI